MKICINLWIIIGMIVGTASYGYPQKERQLLNPAFTTDEVVEDHKLVIYQVLVRHFGNKRTANKHYGSIEENGCGKFNDFTPKALEGLKRLGATHIWYTGVIEHATMTDYQPYGIAADDPDIVKGRAGSPYAIKDYYDVDPDLAVDVVNRMAEFEALVQRTHQQGLKAIIDFVPNHVARTYRSDAKPVGIRDFGENDDTGKAFSPGNDFYYIPGERIVMPKGYDAGGEGFSSPLKDGRFDEYPAKATGNNVFSAHPSLHDWSETVKLNYGVDIQGGNTKHFDPKPPVWLKMRDILLFWAAKGIDGFRCDVAEMVPVEFWQWVIAEVKASHPDMLFIAEAYDRSQYRNFLDTGKFDYLYDKVGLYDGLKKLIRNEPGASVDGIRFVWDEESRGFSNRMLRFLENHDEERIASRHFAGDPWLAVPAMVVSATLSSGPVMVYSGQEVGEPAAGNEGFGGDDGRTSIFDYWGVPQHQKWMNGGQFDGGGLSENERKLRKFYEKLLNISRTNPAISNGRFYELAGTNDNANGSNNKTYAYLRFTEKEKVLVVVNFARDARSVWIKFPDDVIGQLALSGKQLTFDELLWGEQRYTVSDVHVGLPLDMPANGAMILAIEDKR